MQRERERERERDVGFSLCPCFHHPPDTGGNWLIANLGPFKGRIANVNNDRAVTTPEAACSQILSPTVAASDCGIFASSPVFGGCGHLDVDEASQLIACGNQNSATNVVNGRTFSRTMVIPYTGFLFNPAIEVLGGVVSTAGISFAAQ